MNAFVRIEPPRFLRHAPWVVACLMAVSAVCGNRAHAASQRWSRGILLEWAEGDVALFLNDRALPAQEDGSILREGSGLETGDDGRGVLWYEGVARVSLEAGGIVSQTSGAAYSNSEDSNAQLDFLKGEIQLEVEGEAGLDEGRFMVSTPAASIVMGPGFYRVRSGEPKKEESSAVYRIECLRGFARVENEQGRTLAAAGTWVSAEAGSAPSAANPIKGIEGRPLDVRLPELKEEPKGVSKKQLLAAAAALAGILLYFFVRGRSR